MNKLIAHQVPFHAFAALAVITPLVNFGRVAKVTFGDHSRFVDALGEEGLRQYHRAEVNNALYFNRPSSIAIQVTAPPTAEVLAEYPHLEEVFQVEYRKIMSRPDITYRLTGFDEKGMKGIVDETLSAQDAARNIGLSSMESNASLLEVTVAGNGYALVVRGIDAGAHFEWLDSNGDSRGKAFDRLPASVLAMTDELLKRIGSTGNLVHDKIISAFPGFLDDSDVPGADLVDVVNELLAELDAQHPVYAAITAAFPGFVSNHDVDGGDLVEWMDKNLSQLSTLSPLKPCVSAFKYADTVHNRLINKTGIVSAIEGDTLTVLTPSGKLQWAAGDVDLVPEESHPELC